MTPNSISVIIPAINEAETIERAVRSAMEQDAGEVIVVDGGSDDGTQRLAGQAGAVVLQSAPGRATQQNLGFHASRFPILLFLHADNWLGADSLQQVADALDAAPKRWGGGFRQQIDSPRWIYRTLEWGDAARVRYRGLPFGDQGIFVRRSVFEAEGGFPEVPLMEDLILMQRLKKQAWPLLLPGPVHVGTRRWESRGVIRQTLRNFALQIGYACGKSPQQLAGYYPRHDQAT
ncbi:N-glycosyltransferase [Roseimaritima multifibrata]|uniref:N-glycosyltransferase n=1 Tax=Roseimaritima multifibrata TaxID=1930274 RepID=A0A517MGR0_9BACT|nr:TIGR04283 family arsenosugar biosynthesis glycosyltransferase [Roseimaritima multifibrata]QDS94065.1 N-glycosyltransferase [Roseimaritima multifibrata]